MENQTETPIQPTDTRIVDYIMELDWLTTNEFCKKYNIELPSWKGSVELAASEFIRLDAIKCKMIIDYAKKLRRGE